MGKVIIGLAAALIMGALVSPAAFAFDCTNCHSALAKQKVVHAPVSSGFCFMCHDSVDASKIPHEMSSTTKMGLSYDGEALCFACHEREEYTGRPVHGAAGGMDCTTCHDPHASENEKLLR